MENEPKFFGEQDESWWQEWAPLLWRLLILIALFTATLLVALVAA